MTTTRLAPPPRPTTIRPPTPWPVGPELAALRIAYSDIATISASLEEEDSWRPTRCTGWFVRDLVVHLLGDAQRTLVAMATPAAGPTDRDYVSYWTDARLTEDRELRALRTVAGTWELGDLARTFVETTRAVVTLAARTPPDALVATAEGHVVRSVDLVVTAAVKAAVHHLDLVVDLRRPGPRPEPLALVRSTLDALLGHPAPEDWPDDRWALVGTGRVPPGRGERRALGQAAARLPLLG